MSQGEFPIASSTRRCHPDPTSSSVDHMSIKLMSCRKLQDLLGRFHPPVTLIDARPAEEYFLAHIPTAVRAGWEEFTAKPLPGTSLDLREPGYWGTLENPWSGSFEERLSDLGITCDRPIVVYADGERSQGREGRIAWMLAYLGLRHIFLLDGGFSSWRLAGLPTETGETAPLFKGNFRIAVCDSRRVSTGALAASLRSALPVVPVDTRYPHEFMGMNYDYLPRRGRLPGSINLTYDRLFQPDGRFVDRETFLSLLANELKGRAQPVAYCEVGCKAATFALLSEIYTGRIMPVYDGSIMEWSACRSLAVERD